MGNVETVKFWFFSFGSKYGNIPPYSTKDYCTFVYHIHFPTAGHCQCNLGFVGADCSLTMDLCSAQFCLNSAKCLFDGQKTECQCQNGQKSFGGKSTFESFLGFSGNRCEVEQ